MGLLATDSCEELGSDANLDGEWLNMGFFGSDGMGKVVLCYGTAVFSIVLINVMNASILITPLCSSIEITTVVYELTTIIKLSYIT